MDDTVIVEIVDSIEDGADDDDDVVPGKLAFCEDAVKGLSTQKRGSILCETQSRYKT